MVTISAVTPDIILFMQKEAFFSGTAKHEIFNRQRCSLMSSCSKLGNLTILYEFYLSFRTNNDDFSEFPC